MNVTGKERYAVIPDEAIRYAIGRFGRPNVPIDPKVMDRIESLPRTRELRAEPPMAPLAELRRRHRRRSFRDEEFLLRATMPAGQVDAMLAAGPAPRHYDPALQPRDELIRELARAPRPRARRRRESRIQARTAPQSCRDRHDAVLTRARRSAAQGLHVRSGRHAAAERPLAGRL